MFYYRFDDARALCAARDDLPFARIDAPRPADQLTFLFERDPARCRACFVPGDLSELFARNEGVAWLDPARTDAPAFCCDRALTAAFREGRLRAVNLAHPRWRALLAPARSVKQRVHLLALGDVGSTLLLALRLLGGDVISSIGVCDLDPRVSARWETELEQISYPWDYDLLPPVEAISPDALFDCDLFVFCASRGIPPVGSDVRDVRMAQFAGNAAILEPYARMARARNFSGLFAVVSDPVDPLCKSAFLASNRGADGAFDGLGLLPEQIQGFGLGVMNARAAYFAKREPRFASFLTEGRSFGPHGEDLVIANSIAHYDDALSRELTHRTVEANLQIRALGFKPYVAPALSSGALSLLLSLRGEWHCGSVFLGGVYLGVKNRFTPAGLEIETLCLPDPLFARIQTAADRLAEIL